jgi:hypothetical protein
MSRRCGEASKCSLLRFLLGSLQCRWMKLVLQIKTCKVNSAKVTDLHRKTTELTLKKAPNPLLLWTARKAVCVTLINISSMAGRFSILNCLYAQLKIPISAKQWWCMPLIPDSGGRGRRISEFEASLVYRVSSCCSVLLPLLPLLPPLAPQCWGDKSWSDCLLESKSQPALPVQAGCSLSTQRGWCSELCNEPVFMWHYYRGNVNKHLFTSLGNWQQKQEWDHQSPTRRRTKELARVIYWKLGEGFLTGEWMSQRQLCHWNSSHTT